MSLKKLLLMGSLSFVSSLLQAAPLEDVIGVSAHVKGMAGAGVALSRDSSATFYNPAHLADCASSKVTVGYDFFKTVLSTRDVSGKDWESSQVGDAHLVNLGACLKIFPTLGLGIQVSAGAQPSVRATMTTQTAEPYVPMYNGALKSPSIMAGLGFKPIPEFSVGFSGIMNNLISIKQNGSIPVLSGQFTSDVVADVKPSLAFIAGINFNPVSSLVASLVYRSRSFNQFGAQINIKSAGLPVDILLDGALDYSPRQVALGASYQPLPKLTIGADATYYLWSSYQSPFLRAESGSEGSLLSKDQFIKNTPIQFRNTIVPRIGAEYVFNEKTAVRLGYAFKMTPAPVPTGDINLLDSNAHHFSLGAGHVLVTREKVSLSLDLFLGFALLEKITVNKGTADTIPQPRQYTFGGGTYNTGIALTANY